MLLGFTIDFPDNDLYMFENLTLDHCAKFSNIYDLNIIDNNFKFKKKKYNLSSTYEGFVIVSDKFKEFCENGIYKGLEFVVLPNSPGWYWFKVHNIVEYDIDAAKIRFTNFNKECNGYEEITGAYPACLKSKKPLGEGFFRTDVCFGSYSGKDPLYLVGEATRVKLKKAGFKDISYDKILDEYGWQKGDIDPNELIILP